jgi:outer membrane lipoprotein-sorting protein
MKAIGRLASAAALALPLLLAGCSLLPTTRKLPVPKAPSITQTVPPEALVAQLNQRWNAVHTLTATVEIQASELKTKEGLAKDFPSCRGYILMRKPEMLRVVGQDFGMRVFNMVGDGKNFTLYVPAWSKAYIGSYLVKKKSDNPLENLRPEMFLDAMIVRGLAQDDLYSVVSDSETVEDAARKHLYNIPEYVLSISRRKPGLQQLTPVRVVTFTRDNLLPYQQDLFDSEGDLETQVVYANYQKFDSGMFPSKITIKRPLDGLQVVLTVEKVTENMTLKDDQFQINIPQGTTIQDLK